MDEAARTGGPAVGNGPRGPAEIRQDIEQTREELGDTVEALAAKTDVKAQARAKVDETKERARAAVESTASAVKQRLGGSHGDGGEPAERVAGPGVRSADGAPVPSVAGPGVRSAGAIPAALPPDATARLRSDPKPFVLVAVVAAGLLLLWSR